jgi:hypothetical protein
VSGASAIASIESIAPVVARALPAHRVAHAELVEGGLSNVVVRARLEPPLDVVVRVYARDPRACRKEIALLSLVAGRARTPHGRRAAARRRRRRTALRRPVSRVAAPRAAGA